MIHYFYNHKISNNQHGHRRGRGTVTCWLQILGLLNSKYIYEFDYKKFHDRIDRRFLVQSLFNQGFPKEICETLAHLSSPHIYKIHAEDEMKFQTMEDFKFQYTYRGVVQGSNIAGLLANVVLRELGVFDLKKGTLVGYADDGLIFSDNSEAVEEWRTKLRSGESGVEEKVEKSGWVKYDGRWRKELKFVGLCYEAGQGLRASTRSGKTDWVKFESSENYEGDIRKAWEQFQEDWKKVADHTDSDLVNRFSKKVLTEWNGRPYFGLLTNLV